MGGIVYWSIEVINLINEFRCYEAKIEEVKKPAVAGSQTQDTSGLSLQCSATEPQQPAALATQARGVLGSTPGDCQLVYFPLFSPHNI